MHFLTFSRFSHTDFRLFAELTVTVPLVSNALLGSPKRIIARSPKWPASPKLGAYLPTYPNYTYIDSRRRRTHKKQHADRASHLDRTDGVLLYHTTPPYGAQAGRGQVRPTRYVCSLGLLALRPARVRWLTLFHSEAKSAICREQKDKEIE